MLILTNTMDGYDGVISIMQAGGIIFCILFTIFVAVYLVVEVIIPIIDSESSAYSEDHIYFPIMKKGIFSYRIKHRSLKISDAPEFLQKLLRSNIEVPLQNAAKLAKKNKDLSIAYMSYNSYIEAIYNDLQGEMDRCLADDQIKAEMFLKLQSRLHVAEDAAKNVYKAINDKDIENWKYKRDEKDAKLSLMSDQTPFSNLENINKLYDEENGDMSDLVDKYDTTGRIKSQYLPSPMSGEIIEVMVAAGDKVEKEQPLFILESCKMENEIVAPRKGTVSQILVTKGVDVAENDFLCEIEFQE
jgi:biotin carboxyl carrier protein